MYKAAIAKKKLRGDKMMTKRMVLFLLTGLLFTLGTTNAQGPITPSGSPAPGMKTLQEIWDRLGVVEAQAETLGEQVGQLQRDQSATAIVLEQLGVNLPWSITTLSPTGTVVSYDFDYAVSPDGSPFVIWRNSVFPIIDENVATRSANHWDLSNLPDSEGSYIAGALAFSPQGHPTLVESAITTLFVRTYSNGDWTNQVEQVPTGTNSPAFASLTFTPGGDPAMAYYLVGDDTLNYMEKIGSVWSNTVIAPAAYSGYAPSLRFGPEGHPMIAYYNSTDGSLNAARYDGTAWSTSIVDNVYMGNGHAPSLAFSPSGQPMISYFAYDGVSAYYLQIAVYDELTMSWNVSTVDSGLGGGLFASSLAFGPSGRPAIAYSSGSSDLKYAYMNASMTWMLEEVDVDTDFNQVGARCVLRFLPSGYPSIAYWDQTTGTVKFAQRAPFTP